MSSEKKLFDMSGLLYDALLVLNDQCKICWHVLGTFLCNSERERARLKVKENTVSLW